MVRNTKSHCLVTIVQTGTMKFIKQIFGTDNNLSVSGLALPWLPFRVSTGMYYQDGILKTDNTKRFTGNVNLTPSFFHNEPEI